MVRTRTGRVRKAGAGVLVAGILSTLVVVANGSPALAAVANTVCAEAFPVSSSSRVVLRYTLNGAVWTQIRDTPTSGLFGGGFGVVALNSTNQDAYLRRAGSTVWELIAQPNGDQEYAVTDSNVYALLGDFGGVPGDVFRFNGPGITWSRIASGQVTRAIWAGNYGLFASRSNGDLRHYLNGTWTRIGDGTGTFAVGNNTIYGRDAEGIFRYNGSGTSWTRIGEPAFRLWAGGLGLFATDEPSGEVVQYLNSPNQWRRLGLPGGRSVRNLAVTNSFLFAHTTNGAVWVWDNTDGWLVINRGGPTDPAIQRIVPCP